MIVRCTSVDQPGWLALREALWPHSTKDEHLAEMSPLLAAPERHTQFIALLESGLPVGLALHRALGFQETERVVFFRKLLSS